MAIEEDFNYKIYGRLDNGKFRKEMGYQPLEWVIVVKQMKAFGKDTL